MGGPESVSDTGGGAIGDRDLRVSDVEREHVGQLLQRAVGLGMLSLGEFTERMDTALAAKTRGELNAVLIDLPGVRLAGRPAAAPRTGNPVPGFGTSHPTLPVSGQDSGSVIRSRMSGVYRRGPWQVAPTLYLNNWMSGITLDFTQAIRSTQVVEVRIDDYCSSVTLIVPAETTVDLHSLQLIGSSITDKVRAGASSGPLHLVVRGRIRFGSITVRYPFLTQWRQWVAR
ncbi:DUF1707 domain-containing protein [Nocardia sp. 004]|uniref:DUF1707 SHOCT-like domain-containing protein n=1 Tax=Nocardia sp. 004 TaxID=3385978 RepID=UPI0039A02DB8